VKDFLRKEMGLEKRLEDILLYAIGGVNENQEAPTLETISTY
jgi:hypothetical protein